MNGFCPLIPTKTGLKKAFVMKLLADGPMTIGLLTIVINMSGLAVPKLLSIFSADTLSQAYWNPLIGRSLSFSDSNAGLSRCGPYTVVLLR